MKLAKSASSVSNAARILLNIEASFRAARFTALNPTFLLYFSERISSPRICNQANEQPRDAFRFSDRETNCILTLSFIYVKHFPET